MFLESIGGLALVGVFIYIIYQLQEKKEESESTNSELIKNSSKCQELIRDRNDAILKNKPHSSNYEFKKELNKTVNNPEERERAISRAERIAKAEENRKAEDRKKRKVGYKYEIDIFEIFYDDGELSLEDLLSRIINRFNTDEKNAKDLMSLWYKNGLISKCVWDSNSYEIGIYLNSELINLDEDDLTWDKWLKQNNIKIKPGSEKQRKFFEEYDEEEWP